MVRQHDIAAFGRFRTRDDVLAQMARTAAGTLRVDAEARMHGAA